MEEQLTTQDEQDGALAAPVAEPDTAPPAVVVEVEDQPWVPDGAELHADQQPDDRDQLVQALQAHDQRLGELADGDDEDAQQERDAAKDAAKLAQTGIPEPFLRSKFVHRRADGSPIATLVNFTCNRKGCVHASLDKRHAWMHAASHVRRGQ